MAVIQRLVQRHIHRYEIIKKAFFKPAKTKAFRPVITFSREPGSGGRLVAQLVSKKLGFDYYDRNLIDLISSQSRLEKDVVQSLDEKKENSLAAIIKRLFGQEPLPEQAYIKSLAHTILTIGEKGSAVILGRGANFIIAPKKCLNVRVIAPLSRRIKSNMVYDGQRLAEAKESIRKIHFNRKDFIRKYFSKDISNANNYDMVINTNNITLAKAAELVVKLYEGRFRL